jgi:hypothetical protein
MANISSRHHYLPVFYLKGFTDSNNKFYIYNSKWERIEQGSPKMYFYEKDRNTIEINNEKSDFPEESYSDIDNRHARLFQVLQSAKSVPAINVDQMVLLEEFISHVFWRIPRYDEYYKEQLKSNPVFTMAFKILDVKTGLEVNNDFTERIKNSEAFSKAMRPVIAGLSMMAKANNKDLKNWRITYSHKDIHLCCDNPIIFKNNNPKDIFNSDFIFPLTKNHLLVKTLQTVETEILPPEFVMKTHILLFLQNESFCCGIDKTYLTAIKEISKAFNYSTLKDELFSYLENVHN